MALDGKQEGVFEGVDGTNTEGKSFEIGAFVWERDADSEMVAVASEPSEKQVPENLLSEPFAEGHFAEIGDGVVPPNKIDLDADLYHDPDFLLTSGHLDSDGLEDSAGKAEMVDEAFVDPVKNVLTALNQKINMNTFLSVVDSSDATGRVNETSPGDIWLAENDVDGREPTVALGGSPIMRGAVRLLVAMGENGMGVSRNGRVGSSRGGQKKKSVGDGAVLTGGQGSMRIDVPLDLDGLTVVGEDGKVRSLDGVDKSQVGLAGATFPVDIEVVPLEQSM